MKSISRLLTISALSLTLLTSASFAQDHHDDHAQDHHDDNRNNQHDQGGHDQGDHYVRHDDWKKGHRMNNADWSRGQRIDYQQYHLGAPRRGYEWRQVDGNYVMAAVATGLIASVVVASTIH